MNTTLTTQFVDDIVAAGGTIVLTMCVRTVAHVWIIWQTMNVSVPRDIQVQLFQFVSFVIYAKPINSS